MPNVKLYIDFDLLVRLDDRLDAALGELRDVLCQAFGVAEQTCHIVVLGVRSIAGQTAVNVELAALQKQGRTRETVDAICAQVQDLLERRFGSRPAVRCTMMTPETYIVRR